jgi:pantetheine-phosphate adenylyltransferase
MKSSSFYLFSHVALGGTFDHFHKGHELLLKTAFRISNYIIIGLTTDDFIKNKKYSDKLESYSNREKSITNYIINNLHRDQTQFEIQPIKDPFGPAISEKKLEGLVCSEETYNNALKINEIRKKNGLSKLILIVIPLIFDENEQKISSTSFRESEIL